MDNCNCNQQDKYEVIDVYQINQKKAFNFLDTIELDNYLIQDWTVVWIMHKIQQEHGSEYPVESSIFNCISIDEFIEYVKKRYKNKYKIYEYSALKIKSNE